MISRYPSNAFLLLIETCQHSLNPNLESSLLTLRTQISSISRSHRIASAMALIVAGTRAPLSPCASFPCCEDARRAGVQCE
jgi:hypothetical protein